MSNRIFTGVILACNSSKKRQKKAPLLKFETSLFNPEFTETFMSNFECLNLSDKDKKELSREKRKLINQYQKLSPFNLNKDKNKLIDAIESSKESTIRIEASEYGAYICLAAAYSGKLPKDKIITFVLSSSPIALFPKSFLKDKDLSNQIEIIYELKSEHWFDNFECLVKNDDLTFSLIAA